MCSAISTMLILASKSPRRQQLLSKAGYEFTVDPATGEEILPDNITPGDAVLLLSRQKAAEVSLRHKGDIILGADTVVALDNKILGKPATKEDAFDMLSMLSGKTHSVYTGVCIISGDKEISFNSRTDVTFLTLTPSQIREYIATGEPMDKAGAYGIQGKGGAFVSSIKGDYDNVVGLPVKAVTDKLKEFFNC